MLNTGRIYVQRGYAKCLFKHYKFNTVANYSQNAIHHEKLTKTKSNAKIPNKSHTCQANARTI